jgi:anti-sigma-K factor RskA
MKCRNSTNNAKGWRVIIVAVQVGAVKLYVLAVEVVSKKENRVKLSLLQNLLVF